VLTVVWNKQTVATQKNPSSTVSGIVGKSVTVGTGRQGGVNHVTEVVNGPTLLAGYEAFEREFDRSFAAWYSGGLTLETLAERVVDLASSLTPCEVGRWTQAVRNALPVLLGQIFAYFTISRSGQSYKHVVGDAQDESDLAEGVLLKAHNIQILTILRLLGYDSCATETDLASHLMQIRTGEGKSIILGACSALLALLGFRVRCVCYSDFLSHRDYSLFENLFTAFGITKRVVYSKITKFSEDAVATKGDIRQLILDLIEGMSLDTSSGRPSDPQEVGEEILLVDEVDVFFGEDFHGQTYNLVALLESEEVRSLLVKIWEHRAEAQNTARLFRHIQQTEEYKALLGKFSDWEILVKTQVAVMCRDLRHFEEPPYVYDPITDRVGYVVMDSVCYDVTYGYRTAFAYLLHSTAPTEDFRREALRLRVPCGKFSYTHIRPARIFGVSGTLSALGDYEWRVMSQYGLKRYTLLPSVYGESNFRFLDQTGSNPITIVDSENDCHVAITEEARLHTSQGRAVIVFFKGSAELEKYLATSYKSTLSQWSLLREGQSLSHKAQTIKGAATSGQATFTTAVFGRGTDFVCTDKKVLDAGGVHVVVNFVPTDMSELTQLQGRTARQGKAGTFCMVLSAAELQSVGLEAAVLRRKRPEEQYDDIIAGMRRRCMEGQTQKEEQVQTASERDALSHALFDALLEADVQLAKQCFYELYCAESLSEPRSGSDPSSPTAGARVHFTGGFLSDHKSGNGISCVYEPDEFGEYVGAGDYPLNIDAFPNSIRHTFDGVAVDAGTRVTIYSQPNFQGEVLWDRVGPAIVVNELWRDDARYNTVLFNVWKEPLHTIFPPTVREWSGTDMHLWKEGSVRIEDGEPIPQNLKETLPEYGRLDNLTY